MHHTTTQFASAASPDMTFDPFQPYKQVAYDDNKMSLSQSQVKKVSDGDATFTKSTMSISHHEPFVANVEASMFGSQRRSLNKTDESTRY